MKKILFILCFVPALMFGQQMAKDNHFNTIWQDSLTAADTLDIINLNCDYDYIYLAATNDSTNTDSVEVLSGSIGYKYNYTSVLPAYTNNDTIWAATKIDSIGTVLKSSLLFFPTGTTEYFIDNHAVQLLRIVLLNDKLSTIKYRLRAIKHLSY